MSSGIVASSARRSTAVGIADDFNRANSTTTMGSTSTGGIPWTALSGTWGIISNTAYNPGGGGGIVVLEVSTANMTVEAVIQSNDAASMLLARVADANNFYALYPTTTSTFRPYKRVSGTFTALGTDTAWTFGDVIKLTVNGSTLTWYRNGTQVGSITDTSLAGGTKAGFRADTGGRFDNFSAIPAV